jgi:hypothetical protein
VKRSYAIGAGPAITPGITVSPKAPHLPDGPSVQGQTLPSRSGGLSVPRHPRYGSAREPDGR